MNTAVSSEHFTISLEVWDGTRPLSVGGILPKLALSPVSRYPDDRMDAGGHIPCYRPPPLEYVVHTASGWETPRVGGACEINGPPCQIRRSHPREGRYATGLLGAGYSPGVVTRGLRVSHVSASNILTFQFTDAIFSTIPTCDGMGESAPNLHERVETMRHPQPAY